MCRALRKRSDLSVEKRGIRRRETLEANKANNAGEAKAKWTALQSGTGWKTRAKPPHEATDQVGAKDGEITRTSRAEKD